MSKLNSLRYALVAILAALAIGGCASAARDTTGFAVETSQTIPASFEDTWQAVKAVLREEQLELYTRDKRGLFVAYEDLGRRLITPTRIQYTVELVPVSDGQTEVFVEQLRQIYGVTLMTYPDWHDRRTEDDGAAVRILEGVLAKATGVPMTPPVDEVAPEATPAEAPVVEEAPDA